MSLYQTTVFELVQALHVHGLPANNYNVRRLAFLISFHIKKHKIVLTPYQAGNLLKLEIAEVLVRSKGRGFLHTGFPASLN